jgi:hypothetical protein
MKLCSSVLSHFDPKHLTNSWKGFAVVDDDGNEVSPEEYEA